MTHYYFIDSNGEDTNLQIYSLRQAMRGWNELVRDLEEGGEQPKDVKERYVFVLNALGLSISQLLGQNNPAPSSSVPSPLELFRTFATHHNLSGELVTKFERFNYFYNGFRHFGLTTSGRGHRSVDELTFEVAQECYEFGLDIWRVVIDVFRGGSGDDLDDFELEYILDRG